MKQWYVVQVYAGYESQAKDDIERRVEEAGMTEHFGSILIPSAKVKQMFAVMDDSTSEQLFPGYMLIEMELVPGAMKLVTSSLRVSRFLGGVRPEPVSKREIDRIVSQMSGEITVGTDTSLFTVGFEVEIQDGPFANFVGIVDKVDSENEKLTVMVSIFGRMTPVELGFHQVKQ